MDIQENRLAWTATGIAAAALVIGLAVLGLGSFPGETRANAAAPPTDPAQRALLMERFQLKTRIDLCERAAAGEASEYACTPEHRERLPDYRQRIQEIDRALGR